MKNRIIRLTIIVSLSFLYATASLAIKPVYSGGKERAAARGYDVVAYFTENEPVKGNSEFTIEHLGAKWLFSSAENQATFIANPEKYMPQYGGYCAYAVARKSSASSKPTFFTIHENKLYLNYSKSVYKKWIKDKDKYISSADENWPELLAK